MNAAKASKYVALTLSLLVLGAGCTTAGPQGDNQNGAADENQNLNEDAGQNQNGMGETGSELTEAQASAVDNTVDQTEALGEAIAATSYTADVQQPVGGAFRTTQQLPDCPEISVTVDTQAVSFTFELDFGESCTPALYPEVTFSGSVGGEIDFSEAALILTLNEISAGDAAYTGQMQLSYSRDGDTVTFTVDTFELSSSQGGSIEGSGSWSVDVSSGQITIHEGTSGTIEDPEGNSYSFEVTSALLIDPADTGSFIAIDGTVVLSFPNDSFVGPETTEIAITFTEDSPEGTVLVSVNGSEPVEVEL